MALQAGTRLAAYEIESLLGAGGMGEVYRARDPRLGRDVAIKVVPDIVAGSVHALDRFEREARAVAALQHPHICAIYDIGEMSDRRPFIVMELLDGETLQQRLQGGPLAIVTLVDIGIVVAEALDAAHRAGIIHRDIKPANIFLTPRGPKLLDFGLAKSAPGDADDGASRLPTLPPEVHLTEAGSTVGTVAYMSPGASPRRRRRRAHRSVFVGDRPVRDGNRPSGIRRRDARRDLWCHPVSDSAVSPSHSF